MFVFAVDERETIGIVIVRCTDKDVAKKVAKLIEDETTFVAGDQWNATVVTEKKATSKLKKLLADFESDDMDKFKTWLTTDVTYLRSAEQFRYKNTEYAFNCIVD